MGAKHLPFDL